MLLHGPVVAATQHSARSTISRSPTDADLSVLLLLLLLLLPLFPLPFLLAGAGGATVRRGGAAVAAPAGAAST